VSGGGSHSGRSMRHAGTVMAMGAADLLALGRERTARLFDADKDDVVFEHGRFAVTGTNHAIDLFDLAKKTLETDGPLRVVRDTRKCTRRCFPNGAAVCEVEVDPDTGHVQIVRYATVDDVGRCINPMIVHGQTHGGIAQGVGQAMWEHCFVEADSGQPLAGSLMDYAMPRSDDLPSIIAEIAEVISPTNPLGIKARRRRRHHAGTRHRRQCRAGCAEAVRRHRHPDAGHAGTGVARHPDARAAKPASTDKGSA
jgi:carbon-monoxide dehydrogenase large subunit